MKKNSINSIRWIINKSELDIQTIRARLVNNIEAPMQQAMDHAKASTKEEKKRTKHPRELSRLARIFFLQQSIFPSLFKRQTLDYQLFGNQYAR
ncbi:MAG: hypothetical protein OEZ48_07550 [Candidatus Bathyarchaeota archaeon]|nr:hypothetical protein [Candidatus Bathyarchaeota archaeon]